MKKDDEKLLEMIYSLFNILKKKKSNIWYYVTFNEKNKIFGKFQIWNIYISI